MKRTQAQARSKAGTDANKGWLLPKPRRLGWKGLSDAEAKAQAQLAPAELSLGRPRQK